MTDAFVSMIVGAFASFSFYYLVTRIGSYLEEKRRGDRFEEPKPQKTYSKRLWELTSSLTSASSQVDLFLNELSSVAKEREASVRQLQDGLKSLEKQEKDLRDSIEALQQTPLPVADYLARILESREKRSAKRDYVLFGSGVVATTVIAIAIQSLVK